MEFSFYYTAAVILIMTLVLIREWVEPEITVLSALLLLILPGIVTLKEAFAGFSNHGMLTVAFLFVIAGALQRTGILSDIGNYVLGKKGPVPVKLLRLL